jgi:hypothetical protein
MPSALRRRWRRPTVIAATTLVLACADRSRQSGSPAAAESPRPSAAPAIADSGHLPDSLLGVAGLRLLQSPSVVEQVLGPPDSAAVEDASETVGVVFLQWWYPHVRVMFADSQVTAVECRTGACAAPRGLAIGARHADVTRALGVPAIPRPDEPLPAERGVYLSRSGDCGLTFEYVGGRVSGIQLWCMVN